MIEIGNPYVAPRADTHRCFNGDVHVVAVGFDGPVLPGAVGTVAGAVDFFRSSKSTQWVVLWTQAD